MGPEPRLGVLLALVRAGPSSLAVGEIQHKVAIPASTLSHYLSFLKAARLIEPTKDGRTINNQAAFTHIEAVANFLLRDCCADEAER